MVKETKSQNDILHSLKNGVLIASIFAWAAVWAYITVHNSSFFEQIYVAFPIIDSALWRYLIVLVPTGLASSWLIYKAFKLPLKNQKRWLRVFLRTIVVLALVLIMVAFIALIHFYLVWFFYLNKQ